MRLHYTAYLCGFQRLNLPVFERFLLPRILLPDFFFAMPYLQVSTYPVFAAAVPM